MPSPEEKQKPAPTLTTKQDKERKIKSIQEADKRKEQLERIKDLFNRG